MYYSTPQIKILTSTRESQTSHTLYMDCYNDTHDLNKHPTQLSPSRSDQSSLSHTQVRTS